jgi:hydroxymethylglutaryl-CoA lyase
VSTAFWCAFEGKISPQAVISVVEKLIDIGIDEVSISDTIGKASPDEVKRLLDLLLPKISCDRIAMHFHDTYGRGVENVLASWSYGCPFAPGATGNVATEDVVKALDAKGGKVGVDLQKLSQARRLLDPFLIEARRSLPKNGSPACAACQFSKGEVCCQRQISSQTTSNRL